MQRHDFSILNWNYNFVFSFSIGDKLVFSARLGALWTKIVFFSLKSNL